MACPASKLKKPDYQLLHVEDGVIPDGLRGAWKSIRATERIAYAQ